MKLKMNLIKMLIIFLLVFASMAYAGEQTTSIMVLSVSSDGKYVVSSDLKKRIILWNIPDKTFKVISKNGNIYSAYFIKNTDDFMWQNLDDFVHVQNVNGAELLSFHNFPVYGQVMTPDLQHYFASDVDWALYSGYGKQQKTIKLAAGRGSNFFGCQKLMNLTLSSNNQYLLSSGCGDVDYKNKNGVVVSHSEVMKHDDTFDSVMLWNVKTGDPIFRFPGNAAKTFATISAASKYVVSGDEDEWGYVWDIKTGKRLVHLWHIVGGNPIKFDKYGVAYDFDTTGLINPPKEVLALDQADSSVSDIYSLKFIDNDHYLRFDSYLNWAILYNVLDPRPVKYIPLGDSPEPSLDDYSRDQAIDTAPAAHILVVAKRNSSGLIVYQYDPATQTLNKIWTPDADGWF